MVGLTKFVRKWCWPWAHKWGGWYWSETRSIPQKRKYYYKRWCRTCGKEQCKRKWL